MHTPQVLWPRVQADLEVSLSKSMFSLWIRPTEMVGYREVGTDRAIATLTSSTSYHITMLETRFYAHVKEALDRVTGKQCELEFQPPHAAGAPTRQSNKKVVEVIASQDLFSQLPESQNLESANTQLSQQPQSAQPTQPTQPAQQSLRQSQPSNPHSAYSMACHKAGLQDDYIFETFAVSTSNEMAHAAAVAVSQSPGTAYNPLFLYGGVGVGKTHLMQAIGHNILKQNPDLPLAYITGEEFTNEIVAAIQQKKTIQLKHKFRNYKVLLMDDVQFIAGKDTVQEEFFHTFNAIAPAGGQIIMTSDRPPHEMNLLEDRLKSRFESGLIIDIQQPSFELRTAILLIKAKKMGLPLSMEQAQKIASAVESTRKLEGLLAKIQADVNLFHKALSMELIQDQLSKTEQSEFPAQSIKPMEVIKTVAAHFHVSSNSLRGPTRTKNFVLARHIAMYILHNDLHTTLDSVGDLFGGRDHSSVLHAVEKIKTLFPQDENLRTQISAIKTSLSAGF